jgi:hypothetical protein
MNYVILFWNIDESKYETMILPSLEKIQEWVSIANIENLKIWEVGMEVNINGEEV